MIDLLKFDFCEMHIYDNYLVVVMNEGITVTPDQNQVLLNVSETYFKNKNFVYITHRLHSYAVDPAIYFETAKIENLLGFAVVSKDFKAKSNAEVEKLFFKKPFEIFDTVKEAVAWATSILDS
ncbi:MAG: hypothetical protein ABIO60_02875 [Aquaticitalea sp.]